MLTSVSSCCQCFELHAIASLDDIPGFFASKAGRSCDMNLKNGVNGRLGFSIPSRSSADFLV